MSKTDSEIAQELIDDIAGEFASYTVDQLVPYVAETRLSVSEDFWTERYDLAVKLLAGHDLLSAIAGGAGSAAGPVASKSAGELSISYAVSANAASNGAHSGTGWGRRYDALLQTMRYKTPIVV